MNNTVDSVESVDNCLNLNYDNLACKDISRKLVNITDNIDKLEQIINENNNLIKLKIEENLKHSKILETYKIKASELSSLYMKKLQVNNSILSNPSNPSNSSNPSNPSLSDIVKVSLDSNTKIKSSYNKISNNNSNSNHPNSINQGKNTNSIVKINDNTITTVKKISIKDEKCPHEIKDKGIVKKFCTNIDCKYIHEKRLSICPHSITKYDYLVCPNFKKLGYAGCKHLHRLSQICTHDNKCVNFYCKFLHHSGRVFCDNPDNCTKFNNEHYSSYIHPKEWVKNFFENHEKDV
jgi:hypothetical protein